MRIDMKIQGLDKLIDKFSGSDQLMRELSQNLAEASIDLVKEGFDGQVDPYGKRWKETARGGEILSDTGAMKNGWKVKGFSRNRFQITGSVPYTSYHQTGVPKNHLVARKMVPDGRMARKWLNEYSELAEDILEEYFG